MTPETACRQKLPASQMPSVHRLTQTFENEAGLEQQSAPSCSITVPQRQHPGAGHHESVNMPAAAGCTSKVPTVRHAGSTAEVTPATLGKAASYRFMQVFPFWLTHQPR